MGALVQGSLLVISLIQLHILRRRSRHVDSGSLHAAFVETCRDVGLRRIPDLYVGAQLPLVWGVFRPCVFLPNCVSYWTPRGLCNVLHHELAHIRRRDHGAILVAHLACIVHWPNPLVWFLRRFMERDREFACDAQVLADGVEAESYGKTLVELVKCVQNPVQPRVAAAWNVGLLEARLFALGRGVRQPRMAPMAVLAIVWTTTFSLASVSSSLTSGYAPNHDFKVSSQHTTASCAPIRAPLAAHRERREPVSLQQPISSVDKKLQPNIESSHRPRAVSAVSSPGRTRTLGGSLAENVPENGRGVQAQFIAYTSSDSRIGQLSAISRSCQEA